MADVTDWQTVTWQIQRRELSLLWMTGVILTGTSSIKESQQNSNQVFPNFTLVSPGLIMEKESFLITFREMTEKDLSVNCLILSRRIFGVKLLKLVIITIFPKKPKKQKTISYSGCSTFPFSTFQFKYWYKTLVKVEFSKTLDKS